MTERITVDIAIVGGGPAGLAAATAARQSGATVLLVDSFSRAGGQYFMQPVTGQFENEQIRAGKTAIANAEAAGVRVLAGCEIFAAYPGFHLLGTGGGMTYVIKSRAVIAATGAHDRVMAFPGWTLLGVMTAGAGQRLAKVNGTLPGSRIVVAGSGIFLWAVAQTLLDKGADVVALIEARRPGFAFASHLLAYPERWSEAASLYRSVSRGIRRRVFGHVVSEVKGVERAEQIILTSASGSKTETIDGFDALLVSHGFQPNIEITSLLDCRHKFDEALGGWHAAVDADGRTSVNGLYATGETTGIAGFRPASLSGEIAGYSAAADLGFAPSVNDATRARKRRELARARGFGHGLGSLFAPLPVLASQARSDTVLCRCEEITKSQIMAASNEGAESIHVAKMWTRASMGRCQGRMCRMSVTACVAQVTGRSPEEIGYNKPRVPCRPVPLDDALAAMEGLSSG